MYQKPLAFDSAILLLGNDPTEAAEHVRTRKQLRRKHDRLFRIDKNGFDLRVQRWMDSQIMQPWDNTPGKMQE